MRSVTTNARLRLVAFWLDPRGASAVEFSIVSMPFILLLLIILQLGIYFMTQSSLDTGTIQTADALVNTYYSATTPAVLTPAALKALLFSKSGGMIRNDATLSVELRQLSGLGAAVVPVGNAVDASTPGNVLVVRAQAQVISFVPGLSTLYARSSAIVRRQNF